MTARRATLLLLAAVASLPGAGAAGAPKAASPRLAASVHGRIVVVDATGGGRHVLTNRTDGRAVEPAWSPDGDGIAYVRLRRRAAAVFVVAAEGGAPRRLTRDFRVSKESEPWLGQPVWSPDGKRIAFAAPGGMYVAAPSGSLRRIGRAPTAGDGRPQWLANGLLAYCHGYSGRGVLVDPASGRTTEVGRADCGERGPFWSPDGSRYLLALRDGRWNSQLVVLDRRGTRARLTNDVPIDREVRFDDCCARWSEDGSRVTFLSDRIGYYRRDAFVIRNDGRGERRVTWTGDVSDAALSSDGSALAVLRGRTLWVIPLAGGKAVRLADGVNWGWGWEPQAGRPVAQPPVRAVRHAPRRVPVVQRFYRFRRHRLVEVRRFAAVPPGELEGISRNGRYVTFSAWDRSHGYSVGVIDLRRARIRTLATGLTPFYPTAPLAPEGDAILVRRWTRLYRVEIETGRTTFVAAGATAEPAGWLSNGRVRFVDRDGRLVDASAGGRLRSTGLVLPRKLRSYVSWSPGGRYVLYARDCATRLRDLRNGKDRRVAGPAIPGAWSPDGLRFFLATASWEDHCTIPSTALWGGFSVRDVRGRGIFGDWSGFPAWSSDGRFVTVNGGVSGTEVGYLQPLSIVRLRTGTFVPLLQNRLAGIALAGPGGWILYGRFPAGASPEVADARASLYLARLAPRWR